MPSLVIHAEDPTTRTLCEEYWQQRDGKWIVLVGELSRRYGMPAREISKTVGDNSSLISDEVCGICELPLWMKRTRFATGHYLWGRGGKVHPKCARDEEARRAQIEASSRETRKQMIERDESERMTAAWGAGGYRGLEDLELRYLVALVRTGNGEKARKAVGMTRQAQERMDRALDSMGLISIAANMVPDEDIAAPIMSMFPLAKPLPVIPTAPALKVYRALAAKHAYVFPEVSAAAFINLDGVAHLFTKGWHRSYALMCRLDFVVCNPDFTPCFAVEYQGGVHKDRDQIEKDELKAAMLEAAGVEVVAITAADLNRLADMLP